MYSGYQNSPNEFGAAGGKGILIVILVLAALAVGGYFLMKSMAARALSDGSQPSGPDPKDCKSDKSCNTGKGAYWAAAQDYPFDSVNEGPTYCRQGGFKSYELMNPTDAGATIGEGIKYCLGKKGRCPGPNDVPGGPPNLADYGKEWVTGGGTGYNPSGLTANQAVYVEDWGDFGVIGGTQCTGGRGPAATTERRRRRR